MKAKEEKESNRHKAEEAGPQEPDIPEEIEVEDFALDGICGVY